MFDSPPSPETDPVQARAARRAEVLEELIEIAMNVARASGRQATRQAIQEGDSGGHVLAFSRASRCVRQTVALAARLDEGVSMSGHKAAAEPEPFAMRPPIPAEVEPARGVAGEDMAEAVVEPATEAEARERGDGGDGESLLAEPKERLEDEDEFADLANLSFAEAVMRICRDLGVSFDPGRLEDEDFVAAGQAAGEGGAEQRRRLMAELSAGPRGARPGEGGDPGLPGSRSVPEKSPHHRLRRDERGVSQGP